MERRWYQTNLGVIILLVTFFPLGLFNMWKYTTWSIETKYKITGMFLFIIFCFGVIYNLSPRAKRDKITRDKINSIPVVSIQPTNMPVSKYNYEVVDKKEGNNLENYKILIKSGDDGKAIAMEVKKQCKKPCNIDIYDDKHALELQEGYDTMMSTLETQPQELQAWKRNNYVFVADHLVGYVMFDSTDYQEYPYKDWYYDELKNK